MSADCQCTSDGTDSVVYYTVQAKSGTLCILIKSEFGCHAVGVNLTCLDLSPSSHVKAQME